LDPVSLTGKISATGCHEKALIIAKSSGSICAFCGSTFTGQDHRQEVINHTQDKHLTAASTLSLGAKVCPMISPSILPKASDVATKKSSLNPSGRCLPCESTLSWPNLHHLRHSIDFKGIGARWMDELRPRQHKSSPEHLIARVAHTTNHFSHDTHLDSKVLLDRITSRLNSADGRSNTEKLNDFFNGFDLVAEDLSHRL
jgi:hypothetical protein